MIPAKEPLMAIENLNIHVILEKYDKLYISIKNSVKLNKSEPVPSL